MTEGYKGACHVIAFGVGLVLFTYNVGEWIVKRDREHGVNSVIYGAFAGWEICRALRHLRRCQHVG